MGDDGSTAKTRIGPNASCFILSLYCPPSPLFSYTVYILRVFVSLCASILHSFRPDIPLRSLLCNVVVALKYILRRSVLRSRLLICYSLSIGASAPKGAIFKPSKTQALSARPPPNPCKLDTRQLLPSHRVASSIQIHRSPWRKTRNHRSQNGGWAISSSKQWQASNRA